MRRDLPRHCAATVIKSHIKFHGLSRAQWRLTLNNLLRNKQDVVPVYEEVAIESCGIQEAPAFSTAADVSPVPLTEAIVRSPANHWLQHHCMRTAVVVGLHVELDRLALLVGMVLKLWHHALGAELDFAWEQVAGDASPGICNVVLQNIARKALVLEIQGLLYGVLYPSLYDRRPLTRHDEVDLHVYTPLGG